MTTNHCSSSFPPFGFVFFFMLTFNLVASKSNLKYDGLSLRCCTLVEAPTLFRAPSGNPSHPFRGLGIDYLQILQQRLGFTCEYLRSFNATRPANQGHTGFILEMESCTNNGTIIDSPSCQCDIGVGGWLTDSNRLGRVDFVSSFLNDDYRMLTHVDNILTNSRSQAFFLTAFSPFVWVSIFCLCLCFVFLKIFDRNFAPPPDFNSEDLPEDTPRLERLKKVLLKSKFPYRFRHAAQSTISKMMMQSSDTTPGDGNSSRQWLFNHIILLCGLFLVLAYESVMTASLVQENIQADFRTIEDVKNCRIPPSDICVPKGGAAETFWENAISQSPCIETLQFKEPALVDSYEEGVELTAAKKCKYFLASGALTEDAANGRYCNQVRTVGEPFLVGATSFVLPRGSNLTETFSSVTLDLRTEDSLDTINQFLRKRGLCNPSSRVSLTFARLQLFFVIAFSVCLVLFLAMLWRPMKRTGQDKARFEQKIIQLQDSDLRLEIEKRESG